MMLGIVLLTYNRLEYAKITIASAFKNLVCSEPMRLHIASDGDTPAYIEELYLYSIEYVNKEYITISNSERRGYGVNYNLALQNVHNDCEFILPLEDDWELVRPLDINPILSVLRDRVFGCVRMGYIGYTQTLSCDFVYSQGLHWLSLREDSSEPHVFAGHPRIETKAWQRSVGPWDEGLDPNQTEWEVCHRPESRKQVAWPISLVKPEGDAFVHIGAIRSR